MKIAVITEIINSHSGSRAQLEIARALAKLGRDVTVYATDAVLDKEVFKSLKSDSVKIKMSHKPQVFLLGKLTAALTLYKQLKKDKPDIATFSATSPAFIATKMAKVVVVHIYQGTQFDAFLENKTPDQKPTLLEQFLNYLTNVYIYMTEFILYRFSKAVVAISQFCAQESERLYKKKVDAVIYHGTSPIGKKFFPKTSHKKIEVLTVSRFTPYKGFHRIIKAINMLNDNNIHLTIVGSQPKANYIEYLKKIGEGRLEVVINPSDQELTKLYNQADIYANADRYLFFGLPLCEAGYFALPTITFNLAAAPEIIINGQNGFVAKNEKEFANYLKLLKKDKVLRQKLGLNAQKRMMTVFTWEKTAQSYLELFKNIAKK